MPEISGPQTRSVRFRIIVWTAGAILGLIALLVVIHTPSARRFALEQTVQILREQGVTFEASRIDYNLFDLTATLQNVRVQSQTTPDLPPLATADRIFVDLSLQKIIRGDLHLQDGLVQNPIVHLVIDKDGRDNIPKPSKKDESSQSKTDWFIDKFLIKGGSVRFEDRRQQIDARLPVSQISVDGNPATKNHEIKLTSSEPGILSLEQLSMPIRDVGAEVQLQQNGMNIRTLKFGLGTSFLNLSGTLQNFEDPRFDVKAETDLELSSLGKFAGIRQKAEGRFHAELTATGPLKQIQATARIDGNNLTIDMFDRLNVESVVAYDALAQRVLVDSLNVISPSGTIQGKASLALDKQAGASTLNASVRGLDLAKISRTLRLPVQIASRATAELAANWPGMMFEKAAGDATVRLAASSATPAKNVLPVSGTLSAKTRGNQVVIGVRGIRALDSTASGQVVLVNRSTLRGNVQLHAGNVANTLQAAEAFLGRKPGSLVRMEVSGSANLDAQFGGTVKNPTAAATLASPDLSIGTLTGIKIAADADYNPSKLEIKSASVNWQGQQLTASGTVDLKDREQALNLEARSSTLSIPTLLAATGNSDIPASGIVQFDMVVTGTVKDPQAMLNLSGWDLVAYNETLGTLNGKAHLAGKAITFDRLHLEKPQEGSPGALDARGAYDLESRQYRVSAKAENLRFTSLMLPDGTPVRGELGIQAEGAGSIVQPGLQLKLNADNVAYSNSTFGSVAIAAKVANGVADLEAAIPNLNLTARANIGTNEPYPATLEVLAKNTDLTTLPVKLERPIEGTITATIRGTADLKTPKAARVKFEVEQAGLKVNNQLIRTDGALIATYENQVVTIERATITALDSRITLAGKLPLDEKAGTGNIDIESTLNLPSLVSYVPTSHPITAQGTAAIKGTITGTLKSIDPRLNIVLTNGYISSPTFNPPLSNINLQAELADGALVLQKASLDAGPATLTATGEIPFALLPANLPVELPRRQGSAQLTAELHDLDLATIQGLPDDLTGVIAAHLEAKAERTELETLNATLTFPHLQIAMGSYSLEQQGTSTITVRYGTASFERLQLAGPETTITVAGTADLTGDRNLDVKVDGKTDAAILTTFTDVIRARGATEIHVAVTGTMQQPAAAGFVQVTNSQMSLENPRVGFDALNARIELAGNRANLTRLEGSLNGGKLSGGGGLTYQDGRLRDTDLSIKADQVYMDYPVGLKTVSDIAIRLRSTPDNLIVGGEIAIQEGGFTDNLNLDSGVLAALTAPRGLELTERRNPLVESILFDLGVRATNPLLIDNNLAEAEVEANLRLLGNPYQPGLSGRLSIVEGGIIRLNERRYTVERGEVTFTSERKIEPSFDILANTRASDFDVTLRITGVPGKTETTLTSDPPLPEPDILAVLLTGHTVDKLRGQEYEVARNQVLSYLTGRVGGAVGSRIAGTTGLSTVRIEPNLIANETDPSARLTVGQDLTKNLELIYSMDLVNSSEQIYVVEYDVSKRFTTRGIRQEDGSFRGDFRHDVRFGGIREARRGDRRQNLIIDRVNLIGNSYFTEEQLADKLGAKVGKRYDFFKSRKGIERVQRMHRKQNLLEAQVRLDRQVEGGKVGLTLEATPGPVVEFVWEGMSPSGGLEKRVREIWQSGVFDRQRGDDLVQEIRTELVEDGYLRPELKYSILTPAPDRKRVLLDINRGRQFSNVKLEFEGATGIKPDTLRDLVKSQKLSKEVYVKPGRVTELLTRYYAEEGYLEASIEDPRYELDDNTGAGRVVFPVKEGPLFRIAEVEFEGNNVYDDAKLVATLPLPKGEVYRPVLRERSLQAIRELYWEQGYNDVDTDISTRRNRETGTVDVLVKIAEHRQGVIRKIEIEGNQKTSLNLIQTQIVLKEGDVLNLQKLSESRRNLYNAGAYSVVDIAREELPAATTEKPRSNPENALTLVEKPMRVNVKVQEVQPFQIRYGASYDTERGPGVIADFENRNSLGSARTLGLRTRYDSQLREARLYFSQPTLRRFPLETVVSPYWRQERNPSTVDSDPFNVDRLGLSIQQETRFRKFYIFNYGYRIEQSKTEILSDIPVPTAHLRIAALTSTLTRETRDDVLDATRGDLISNAFEFSPEFLGSQVQFIKYFGQYFKYIPLEKPKVEIFTNKVQRPRFVYAGAIRIGLSKGLSGQEVPLSERFFAGGSNTIRGFEQNSVGPELADRTPLGGEAMLVINNEVRHRLFSIFDIAGFIDIGNVYEKVSDMSLGDLRKAAGVGLRVRTPWILVRLDYGFKLDRRPEESVGRFFFSIGQAW